MLFLQIDLHQPFLVVSNETYLKTLVRFWYINLHQVCLVGFFKIYAQNLAFKVVFKKYIFLIVQTNLT